MNGKEINFDSRDIDAMRELMDSVVGDPDEYTGKNDEEESLSILVCRDKIIVTTFQNNGWTRTDTYDRDGSCNEIFTPPTRKK